MMDVLEPSSGKLSDRAACVAALTRLQKDVLPRAATTAAARSILQSSSIAAGTDGTFGNDTHSFDEDGTGGSERIGQCCSDDGQHQSFVGCS